MNKRKSRALKVVAGVLHGFLCMYTGFFACTLACMRVHFFICVYTCFYACTLVSMRVHWLLGMYTGFFACITFPAHLWGHSWSYGGPIDNNLIKSILHAIICILFDFNGARSNRTRDVLFGPPLGALLVLWWSDRKYTSSNQFYMS